MNHTTACSNLDILKQRLTIELNRQDKSGIYALTSKRLAYNSNKIEGSSLTPEHTNSLFTEGYMESDTVYRTNEVEEMQGHFLMFNYAIIVLDKPLTSDIIKQIHFEFRSGVFKDRLNGYNIGDYKSRQNYIGDYKTTIPSEVANEMNELLNWYSVNQVTLNALAEFHIRYEKIHPFQDGNGRTGRVILFKEALKNNIMPFIIQDTDRVDYVKALSNNDINYLVTLFEKRQKDYNRLLTEFIV